MAQYIIYHILLVPSAWSGHPPSNIFKTTIWVYSNPTAKTTSRKAAERRERGR